MEIEHTGIVLLVPNRDVWEARTEGYLRSRKRIETWISGVFGFGMTAACAFVATMYYPLLSGDIAFGHPRYDFYRGGSDLALILFAVAVVLYAASLAAFQRWVRKNNERLGLRPDGSVADVREAFTASVGKPV